METLFCLPIKSDDHFSLKSHHLPRPVSDSPVLDSPACYSPVFWMHPGFIDTPLMGHLAFLNSSLVISVHLPSRQRSCFASPFCALHSACVLRWVWTLLRLPEVTVDCQTPLFTGFFPGKGILGWVTSFSSRTLCVGKQQVFSNSKYLTRTASMPGTELSDARFGGESEWCFCPVFCKLICSMNDSQIHILNNDATEQALTCYWRSTGLKPDYVTLGW